MLAGSTPVSASARAAASRRSARVHPRLERDQPLLDDLGHRQPRRQRTVGVLEDDLHVAPERPHLARRQPAQAPAAIGDRPLRADQPRIARPSVVLPEPDSPTTPTVWPSRTVERHAVDRLHMADRAAQEAVADWEPHPHVLGLDDRPRRQIAGRRLALRLGGEQHLGIGVLRIGEHLGGLARFDDLALLHHRDVAGDLAHDAEIVGDEQQRHAELGLQVLEQREDLRLDGDVERGRRLVGDEQVGAVGERHGDHHPLPLAAGQLVRIGAEPGGWIGDADLGQQADHPFARRSGATAVQGDDLADLALDGVQRIERGHRLLEHHRHAGAAHFAQLRVAHRQHVATLEEDLA